MKKYLLTLSALALSALSACTVVDSTGKSVPVVISPQPAVIIDARTVDVKDPNAPIYVCSITPFIDTFKAENTNRGRAILDVKKQCLAKNAEMFCTEENIKCQVYQ